MKKSGIIEQSPTQIRLFKKELHRSLSRGNRSWRQRGGKDKGTGFVDEPLPKTGGTGHKTAVPPEGFTDGAGNHVGTDAEPTANAAAAGTKNTHSMGLINHQERIELLGKTMDFLQWSNVAIHAENGIDNNEKPPLPFSAALKKTTQFDGIIMAKALPLGAAQANAVDEAGVIEAIEKYQIPGPANAEITPRLVKKPLPKTRALS